jgi:transposase
MKDCTLQLWETGWTREDICSVLTVSQSSLYRWARIFDDFGSVTPPPSLMQGRPRIIGMAAITAIKEIYA